MLHNQQQKHFQQSSRNKFKCPKATVVVSGHCVSYLLSLLLQVKCTNYMRVSHMFRLPQRTAPPQPTNLSLFSSTQNNAKLCTAFVVAVVVQCVAAKDKNKQGNKSFSPKTRRN